MFKSPSSSSHSFKSNTAKLEMFIHVRNQQYTDFHISTFRSRRSLGRKPLFFSPLGFNVQKQSDLETPKIRLYSDRALKHYLNEKNLIHGRGRAVISKFSA